MTRHLHLDVVAGGSPLAKNRDRRVGGGRWGGGQEPVKIDQTLYEIFLRGPSRLKGSIFTLCGVKITLLFLLLRIRGDPFFSNIR